MTWSDLTPQVGTPLMVVTSSRTISRDWLGGSTSRRGVLVAVRMCSYWCEYESRLLNGSWCVVIVASTTTKFVSSVYAPLTEAATCCAWASDGRLCAAGGAAGELRVMPAPPAGAAGVAPSAPASPSAPCELVGAHDTGVLSCDFAPGVDSDETKYILATAGRDALLKIWEVVLEDDLCGEASVNVRLLNSTEAHGGAVESVRWGSDGVLLATSGADGWARVWLVGKDGSTALQAAVPSGSAAGASAAALLGSSLLAVGSLLGELAVWQLPLARAHDAHVDNYEDDCDMQDEDACAEPRLWGVRGALRWLRDYVTRVPGAVAGAGSKAGSGAGSLSAAAERAAREHEVTGARLLVEPLDELLQLLAPAPKIDSSSQKKDEVETEEEHAALRGSLRRELLQLRRGSPPGAVIALLSVWRRRVRAGVRAAQEARAPHRLLCPLTHALLREPVRAADGFSYERANILEYFFAAGDAVSPLTGRRLRSACTPLNRALLRQLRDFLDSA
ncbi:WD repeat, SAM and U-box domain-containing protein 1-like [Battus philenor]|uniref:WD repeat, SAM and U-box domain-containing protein 1-like n=1 Tax=Battus philenor TaxID=42288 RepID=UPI0035CFDA1E